MKTWFITGISRGLGKALAEAALARGDTVIGTVRTGNPEISQGKGTLHVLSLEMTDGAAVAAAVTQAFELGGGRVDVIVNNAGYGLLGAVEHATDEEVSRLLEVDVLGPFRVIRAALPQLRAQGSGHIVNITSIAGRAAIASAGLYSTAKFALEGLSQSLAAELAPLGIKVTAVAPGAFRTDFLSAHSIRKSAATGDGYREHVGQRIQATSQRDGLQPGDPALAAAAILTLADAEAPPVQLLLGSDALNRARQRLAATNAEIDQWEEVTLSTDFPEGA